MAREYVLRPYRAAAKLHIDYERELNPQQLAAVTAPPGPALVLAGAGAGKTRTLTYRVAYLLEQGVPADRILLLTFTNKAAKEMMRRVSELIGSDLNELWGGTFHSVGHRILRRHAEKVGYGADFTILDSEDAHDVLKLVLGESEIDTKALNFPKADLLGSIISLAVNTCRPIPEVLSQQFEHLVSLAPLIEQVARSYAERKRATNVVDFDDLLALWLKLLREHPDVCEHYQRRFQFILVDEYQDTNRLQAEIIDVLAARHHNVMVVGDDSQSIYSWRGADFHNILEFPKRYPEARVYKIETNYRSTPEILSLANAAITANTRQFFKQLTPVRKGGQKPALVPCQDALQQAAFVAQQIMQLYEEGVPLKEIAVLYRSHFHAVELQLELSRRQIPFVITSGIRFFEQAHLKDVVAYLKLICNPADELAFKRLVLMLPGIGPKGATRLWAHFREVLGKASAESASDAQADRAASEKSAALRCPVATAFQRIGSQVPKKAAPHWTNLAVTFSQIETPELRSKPAQMIRHLLEAGYEEYLKEHYANYRSRLEDVEQLAIYAEQFTDLQELLAQLSLLTSVEAEAEQAGAADEDRVRLSTIHQAKGLEFDVVFVIMLCEGLFPSQRSIGRPESEEEERRLFYVAITRARNELYLTYPLLRTIGGQAEIFQQPSRFVEELPRELIEEWSLKLAPGAYADFDE